MPNTNCADCGFRSTDEYGCINNQDSYDVPPSLCLMCCGCPDHEMWWGSKCCAHAYHDDECECCLDNCDDCMGD